MTEVTGRIIWILIGVVIAESVRALFKFTTSWIRARSKRPQCKLDLDVEYLKSRNKSHLYRVKINLQNTGSVNLQYLKWRILFPTQLRSKGDGGTDIESSRSTDTHTCYQGDSEFKSLDEVEPNDTFCIKMLTLETPEQGFGELDYNPSIVVEVFDKHNRIIIEQLDIISHLVRI